MVDDQHPATTLTLADSRIRNGIRLGRLATVVLLLLAGMGLLAFAGEAFSLVFFGLLVLGFCGLVVEPPETGILDRPAATFTVRRRHLIGHRTVVYPLVAICGFVVSNRNIEFILDNGKWITLGPFTDVTATAQQIDAFFAAV